MTQRNIKTGTIRRIGLGAALEPVPRGQLGLRPEDSVQDNTHEADETCSICLDNFSDGPAIRLVHCRGHYFHRQCIEQAFTRKASCPVCCHIYQPLFGNQPPGQMLIKKNEDISLPGYDSCGTIVIQYIVPSGIQGPDHYHPSADYEGTERVAYLPLIPEGCEIAELLRRAFRRRLIFTIGRSATTGLEDSVIWNGIHHKTSTTGGSTGHGYPDPEYLQRVRDELQALGVTQ